MSAIGYENMNMKRPGGTHQLSVQGSPPFIQFVLVIQFAPFVEEYKLESAV